MWKRILVAGGVLALLGGGYAGVKVYKHYFPDFTYTIDSCSADDRTARMDFRITNKKSRVEDIRIILEYRDRSGKRLGDDTVEVERIKPGQTVRSVQETRLTAPAASITCHVDRVYVD